MSLALAIGAQTKRLARAETSAGKKSQSNVAGNVKRAITAGISIALVVD
jgi:hypothetical protein